MSRRRIAKRKDLNPDPKHGSVLVAKFVNLLMLEGKKSVSESILYAALDDASKKVGCKAIEVLDRALDNVCPSIEVRSRRVGGATYQIPMEIRRSRSLSLAFKWIIAAARKCGKGAMSKKLANELVDAFNSCGLSVKKKEDTHKMAEANRAFAHFRW